MCRRVSLKEEASVEAEGLQQQQETSLRALPVRPEQKTEATVEDCFQHLVTSMPQRIKAVPNK